MCKSSKEILFINILCLSIGYHNFDEFVEHVQDHAYEKTSEDETSDDEIKEDLLTHIQKKMSKSNIFCTPKFEEEVIKTLLLLYYQFINVFCYF